MGMRFGTLCRGWQHRWGHTETRRRRSGGRPAAQPEIDRVVLSGYKRCCRCTTEKPSYHNLQVSTSSSVTTKSNLKKKNQNQENSIKFTNYRIKKINKTVEKTHTSEKLKEELELRDRDISTPPPANHQH